MQSSNNILLIKPVAFSFNPETAESNAFQLNPLKENEATKKVAIFEFEQMAQKLAKKGINTTVISDTLMPLKPDAIFPNNWVTFHANGTAILYPMLAVNRRKERRNDILNIIGEKFEVKKLIDLSIYEKDNIFLEGTGSIIFDHINKTAYACLSPRTDKDLFIKTCKNLGYHPIYFYSIDSKGKEIYHTNVMMTIGNGYVVICLESIQNKKEQKNVISSLVNSGLKIIDISYDQTNTFCGNMLELELPEKKNILAMSDSAFNSLTIDQKTILEEFCELFPLNINTIEQVGGGSVRCMIAEIFLPLKEE